MSQPSTFSDVPGSEIVKHGSQIVNFNLAGALVAEEITWQKGFKSIDFSSDETGIDRRAAYCSTKAVGSMTVQLKSSSTVIFPGEFVTIAHVGFSPITFIVTNVGITYTQNGATKCPVQIAEWMSASPLPQILTLDGDFSNATACGAIRISRPFPKITSHLMARQKFCIYRDFFVPGTLNSGAPFGPNWYLVEETEPEDTGIAKVVTWDKSWSNLPSDWNEAVEATKVFQSAIYQYHDVAPPPNYVIDQAIVNSYSESIKANMLHRYFLDQGSLPAHGRIPFIQAGQFAGQAYVTDFGTGFPTSVFGGHTFFWNNIGINTIIDVKIRPFLGKMYTMEIVTGS